YLVAVNAEGFAEYTSKGISATYLFFDENNIPEEYKEAIVETTTETAPSGQPGQDDPNSTKPSPKKGSTALVAVCAIVVSVGGAVIYGIASGSLGGKKK
ncbi:MAG: hypothetical protein IKZ19_03995, partial [Clostridia bacterium]|nr:hypothetical protein [Clostridia bacterium]